MPRVSCSEMLATTFLFFVLYPGSVAVQPQTTGRATDSPRIVSFKREAEKAIGKYIHITYVDELGPSAGNSRCVDNPVEIKIDRNFGPKTRELLIAHELGHVMLCSRHIEIRITYDPAIPIPSKMKPLSDDLVSQINSCFLDPLANAEAEKRGFAVRHLEKLTMDYLKTIDESDLRQSIETYGEYARDFTVLSIYCFELRANKRIPEGEAFISKEPDVVRELESLRRNLGTPSCDDKYSCYFISKKLRDQFNWKIFLQMENPITGLRE